MYEVVDKLAQAKAMLKALKEEEKLLITEVSRLMGNEHVLLGYHNIAKQIISTRKGPVDFAAMIRDGIDVDKYRDPDISVYSIRVEPQRP